MQYLQLLPKETLRVLDTCRQALAETGTLVIMHQFIYPVHLLVVPCMTCPADPKEYLAKTLLKDRRLPYGFLNLAVVTPAFIVEI